MYRTDYPLKLDQIHEFDNLELVAKLVVEGFITGLHKSPFHGFSVEFAEHRIYNAGESTRHIDWKLYGRTEKLFVKKFEEETNLRSYIVIDTSSSMLFPYHDNKKISKLVFSVVSAAALIHLLRRQRDAVGLTLFSNQIDLQTPSRLSPVHARYLFSELQKLINPDFNALKRTTSAAKSLHLIAENTHKRSLIILFSDMISSENPDEIFTALQHLRHNKHEVILFNVTDKQLEQKFLFGNRPFRFIDMETTAELKLNPNNVREEYTQAMKKFITELKLRCGQYNIDLVEADINESFTEVLQPYLLKRSKLY
ncbi:MAG: DUF58 domain-containing protein [Bacteroidetes bacterium CG23_combo_of_CG06-09_8_20_14_all_32_9]|nr:MAG: DUF58 domain-containing protein [Bacteroidetes bacterium CG23_combo_of_CG06-09_8_20_14_all_32_9]